MSTHGASRGATDQTPPELQAPESGPYADHGAVRRLRLAMAVVGLLVALAGAAGAAVPGARGARLTGDEPHYLLTAVSLAEDRDLDIADELAEQRYQPFHERKLTGQGGPLPDGRRLSPHDPLLPVLLAAPVAVGGWVAAKITLAGLAGILAALLLWTAVRRFGVSPRTSAMTVAGFGLSSPLVVYASQAYPELAAALAVTIAVALLTGPFRRAAQCGFATAVVVLPWLSVKYVPVAAVLAGAGIVRLCRRHQRRTAAVLVGALAVGSATYLAAHQVIYGGWTAYAAADHFPTGEFAVVGEHPNFAERSPRLLGLLVDARYGLAGWQPAWLLAVPAVAALARRRPEGWGVLLLPLAAGWCTAAFLAVTMHGLWWPGRHAIAALPAAVLAIAWWVDARQLRLKTPAVLASLGVLTYAWLVIEAVARGSSWLAAISHTTAPVARAGRIILPDFRDPTVLTWLLAAAWLAGLATLAWWHGLGNRPRRSQ